MAEIAVALIVVIRIFPPINYLAHCRCIPFNLGGQYYMVAQCLVGAQGKLSLHMGLGGGVIDAENRTVKQVLGPIPSLSFHFLHAIQFFYPNILVIHLLPNLVIFPSAV